MFNLQEEVIDGMIKSGKYDQLLEYYQDNYRDITFNTIKEVTEKLYEYDRIEADSGYKEYIDRTEYRHFLMYTFEERRLVPLYSLFQSKIAVQKRRDRRKLSIEIRANECYFEVCIRK